MYVYGNTIYVNSYWRCDIAKRTKQQLNQRIRLPNNPPKPKPALKAKSPKIMVIPNLRTGTLRYYKNGQVFLTMPPMMYTHIGD